MFLNIIDSENGTGVYINFTLVERMYQRRDKDGREQTVIVLTSGSLLGTFETPTNIVRNLRESYQHYK